MPRNRFALLLAALLIALAADGASAQVRNLIPRLFKSGETTRTAFADLVAEASQSVVQVLGDGKVIALGVVADSDGFILTKASELGGKLECKTKDGKSFAATIIGVQNTHDIAMLKIDAKGLKPVKWAGNTKPEVGSWLATVGTGKEPVAVGVVSTPRRVIPRQPGALGISKLPKDQTDDPNPNSEARIGQVYPNSAASEAGLKEGDVITHVDGKAVAT